mgnify:CR=1 FL=1
MNEINKGKEKDSQEKIKFQAESPKLDKLVKTGKISSSTAEKVKISKSIIENKYLKLKKRERIKQLNWNKIENYLSTIKNLTDKEKNEIKIIAKLKENQLYRMTRKKLSIDNFEILNPIGIGGFGEVNICRYKDTGKIYAMKKITFESLKYKNGLLNVQTEKDILSLNNNNIWITQLRYSFIDNKHLYLIMDFCPGGDFMNYLIKRDLLEESEARFYIAEIILCVHSLHKMNCIHRDLKPDNILIAEDGHIKLSDFGLSFIPSDKLFPLSNIKNKETPQSEKIYNYSMNNNQIIAYSNVGSPDYISPEIIKNEGYGQEIDWWSVGAIFYEMLMGIPPFFSDNPQMTCMKIKNYKKYLSFPKERKISPEAKKLIYDFLTEPKKRLGFNGIEEIKNHIFFKDFNWEKIREMKPPFVPELSSPDDIKYFLNKKIKSIRFTNALKRTNIFFNQVENKDNNNKTLFSKFCFQYNRDLVDLENNMYDELIDLVHKEVEFKLQNKISLEEVSSEAKSSSESINNMNSSASGRNLRRGTKVNLNLFSLHEYFNFTYPTILTDKKKSLSIVPIRNLMNKQIKMENQNVKTNINKRIKLKRGPGKLYSIRITSGKSSYLKV